MPLPGVETEAEHREKSSSKYLIRTSLRRLFPVLATLLWIGLGVGFLIGVSWPASQFLLFGLMSLTLILVLGFGSLQQPNSDQLYELLGLLIFSVFLLVGMSLASYQPSDPVTLDLGRDTEGILNYVGPLGAFTSHFLIREIGLLSAALTLLFLVRGFLLMLPEHRGHSIRRTTVWLLLLSSTAMLCQALDLGVHWHGKWIQPMGRMGGQANDILQNRYGGAGTVFIVSFMIIISCLLLFRRFIQRRWLIQAMVGAESVFRLAGRASITTEETFRESWENLGTDLRYAAWKKLKKRTSR